MPQGAPQLFLYSAVSVLGVPGRQKVTSLENTVKLVEYLNETPGSAHLFFPVLASTETTSSAMCPWPLEGKGGPGSTWNKAEANLIMMSFIQEGRGDIGCPLKVTVGTPTRRQGPWGTGSEPGGVTGTQDSGAPTRRTAVGASVTQTASVSLTPKLLTPDIGCSRVEGLHVHCAEMF